MSNHERPVAFITGAASGIGLALARRLATQGARVILADRNAEQLESALGALRREGAAASSEVLDVTDRAAFIAAVDRAAEQHGGRLDYLFNNAGVGLAAEARDTPAASWRQVMEVNLHGVIHGIEAAYPRMMEQQRGHIVNVASVAGLVPLPGEAAYVASKYAVVGLSHTLRAEAADLGVRVSVVCPGVVRTAIYDTSPVIGFDKDKALALWPRGITAEACAAQIMAGVERNRATIVVTPMAQLLWRLQRLSPDLFVAAGVHYIRRLRQTARSR